MTSALKAWGTTVSFDGVTIGEITSYQGTRTREMIEVFSCDSTDEAVEYLTSGLNEGTWTCGCVYQPGNAQNYDILNDKYLEGRTGTLVVTLATPAGASAPILSVSAIIANLSVPAFGSAREVDMVEVTFQTSGKVTYTDSSGSSASASPSVSVSSSPS
jgi:hypothetical protein